MADTAARYLHDFPDHGLADFFRPVLTTTLAYSPIDPRLFAGRISSWLRADTDGADDMDVVVSCRVRLARNLDGHPFSARLDPERAEAVAALIEPEVSAAKLDGASRRIEAE